MKNILNWGLIFSLFLVVACSGEEEVDDEFYGSVNEPSALLLDSNEARIYTLPTPLQIASVMKAHDVKFSDELLLPLKRPPEYSTSFLKALNLGIYTIDLGYVTVYENYGRSAIYAESVKTLMDDLGIKGVASESMMTRYENNINNKDSLCVIILESYESAHRHFQNSGREGIGLLILTGCYIEGLYLSSNYSTNTDPSSANMMGQQKISLDNLIELLGYYVNAKDVASLISDLKELKTEFNKIEVSYDEETSKLITKGISAETLQGIKEKITALRNKIAEQETS